MSGAEIARCWAVVSVTECIFDKNGELCAGLRVSFNNEPQHVGLSNRRMHRRGAVENHIFLGRVRVAVQPEPLQLVESVLIQQRDVPVVARRAD